ncbi:MAG: methyltransferase domain-containing protein [Rhodobacter sp.]|nr:methyltransferase domain-containing protein [Rhodobacter sp.]
MAGTFFDKVYNLGDAGETRDFYDRWSDQYDADVTGAGYATPGRVARALASQMADLTVPILDFGCGTGISGGALRNAGFTTIDGLDPSAEMLAGAREKGIYRRLTHTNPGDPAPAGYAAIAAIGVIGCGAAPVSVFDEIMAALAPGGLFTLSYNDHALEEPDYEGKLKSYTDTGKARLLVEEYGPHLPELGTNSKVYVLEKA